MGGLISKSRYKEEDHLTISSKRSIERQEDIEARERRKKKRLKAVEELLQTEKTYVSLMEGCIQAYMEPLANLPKIISAKDHKTLFSDLKIIYGFNSQFLKDMQDRWSIWDNEKTRLGDLFLNFVPYFRMYQQYLNNYDNANALLPKLNKKQAFIQFCQDARTACGNQPIESLLILPIQRLPRYKLCLTEIVKNTEYTHPDLSDLQRALDQVAETTTLINERMKEFEQRQTVRVIEHRFSSRVSLVKPHRRFVKEGELTKILRTGKHRRTTFFLFNDCVVYASGNPDRLRLHNELPIDRAFFTKDIINHPAFQNRGFELYSGVKSFICLADSREIKESWMQAMSKCVKEMLRQPGRTQERELAAPLMVPDDFSDTCQMPDCDTKFTFVNRRHHCRYCGKLVCSKCGKYKLASRTNKMKCVKPVCQICHRQWNSAYPAPKNGIFEDFDMRDSDDEKID